MSNEEYTLIRDYVLFPQLTAAIQRSLDELELKPNVLNRLYSASGTYIKQQITVDLRENRLAINRAGLRVIRAVEANGMIHVEVKRRAQVEVFTIAREVLRKELSVRMAQYLAEFGAVVENVAVEKREVLAEK